MNSSTVLRVAVCSALGAMVLPGGSDARAQERGAALDEILVTAQRRVENVQEVPISMSVFGAADLEDGGVRRIEDFIGQVPNVYINFNSSIRATAISMRGIISDPNSVGIDPAVGVYVDGVYMGRPTTVNVGLHDLERVEVLRGPQGTLFGYNTIAGVMSFVSRLPGDEPEFAVTAGVGNLNARTASVVGNLPIAPGRVAVRGAMQYEKRDGFLRNLAGPDNNDADNLNGRIALSFTPSDELSLVFRADAARDRTRLGGVEVWVPSPLFAGEPFNTPHDLDPWDRVINDSRSSFQDRDVFGTSVEVNWDVGPGTLTSITAYREFDWNNFQTTDKSPFDIFGTGITEDQDQFSQELRFAGTAGERIDYVVGALYFTQTMKAEAYADVGADAFSPFGAPLGGNPAPGTGFIDIRTRAESMAAFAQVDWRMTDALQATLGVRYTAEDKSINHQLFGEPTGTFVPSVPLNRFERSDREPSWRAGLQYFVNDDVMAYASYSRGFKAGGYNAFAFQIVQPDGTPADFEPEFVDNYEIGLKTLLADGRVRFNATAFFMDYRDLQVNQLIPNAQGVIDFQTSNAATAETRGIEIEVAARLMAGLDLTVGYGYTDAKFKRFPGATPGGDDFGGNRLAQSPRQSLGATLQYRYGLTGDWDLMARGEYTHRGRRFSDAANSPALEVPAHDLVNVRLGLERSDGTLAAWLWSRNLFDKDYANSRFFGSPAFAPGAIFQNIGIERTWGLEVSYRWTGR